MPRARYNDSIRKRGRDAELAVVLPTLLAPSASSASRPASTRDSSRPDLMKFVEGVGIGVVVFVFQNLPVLSLVVSTVSFTRHLKITQRQTDRNLKSFATHLHGNAVVTRLDILPRQRFGRLHQQKKGVHDEHGVHPVLEPRVLDDLTQPLPEIGLEEIFVCFFPCFFFFFFSQVSPFRFGWRLGNQRDGCFCPQSRGRWAERRTG